MPNWSWLPALACLIPSYAASQDFPGVLPPGFEEHACGPTGEACFAVRARGYAAVFDRDGATFHDATHADGGASVQMRLEGASAQASPAANGRELLESTSYNEASGAAGVRLRNYSAIRYRAVYDGIDWVWGFSGSSLEFQFQVAPEADPRAIRIVFEGARKIVVNDAGELEIDADPQLRYRPPVAWQDTPQGRTDVPVRFHVVGHLVTFEVAPHDPAFALTIDPVVRYSRYLGGAGFDSARAVATDAGGNVYVTGETNSFDFGSSRGIRLTRDVFVAKLSSDGAQTLYTVFLSSSGNDAGNGIAVDQGGNVWVTGVAGGSGFPSTVSLSGGGAEDAFLAKLNSTGSLVYATRLGGSGMDAATAIGIDSGGNVYVSGYTWSVNFPATAAAPQRTARGLADAFVAKIRAAGGSLEYATLLGGPGMDVANALAVDGSGNACIAGRTESNNLPVTNAIQPYYGGSGDAFAGCLNASGTAWTILTYYGGVAPDQGNALTRDSSGYLYMAGETFSTIGASTGSYDAFVMKLTPAGTAVVYISLFGGSGADTATAVAADATGVWVAGSTASTNFTAANPSLFRGGYDCFLLKLGQGGTTVEVSEYIGGAGEDRCTALTLLPTGEAIIAGITGSSDFPITTGAVPSPYSAFVLLWKPEKAALTNPAPGSELTTSTVTFSWSPGAAATAYWLDINNSCVGCGGGLYGRNLGLATSQTVSGLPINGGALFVRLWTQFGGATWQYTDYIYTTLGIKAVLRTPAPASVLTGSATFTWSAGTVATAYWLDVGTAPGVGNYFGRNVGLATSQAVTGLPTNGSTIYVRLWTLFGNRWAYNDYSFVAGEATKAAILSPTPGSTLNSSATFTWRQGTGATAYWLDVGPYPGVGSYFGRNLGLATSQAVTGLPTNGSTIYVRLWTQFGSSWVYNDYSYTTAH